MKDVRAHCNLAPRPLMLKLGPLILSGVLSYGQLFFSKLDGKQDGHVDEDIVQLESSNKRGQNTLQLRFVFATSCLHD